MRLVFFLDIHVYGNTEQILTFNTFFLYGHIGPDPRAMNFKILVKGIMDIITFPHMCGKREDEF